MRQSASDLRLDLLIAWNGSWKSMAPFGSYPLLRRLLRPFEVEEVAAVQPSACWPIVVRMLADAPQ